MKGTAKEDIREMYGCDESPLAYMIESRISVELKDKDEELDPDDFESIL